MVICNNTHKKPTIIKAAYMENYNPHSGICVLPILFPEL